MSRIRMTEDQFLMFGKTPGRSQRSLRTKKNKSLLPENIVEEQILGFLRAHRWVVTRQQVGLYVPYRCYAELLNTGRPMREAPIRIGEKGRCDWIAERPAGGFSASPFVVERFELEIKAPGEQPETHQDDYMRRRRAAGFAAEWFDCLEHGFKPLRAWYDERFQL